MLPKNDHLAVLRLFALYAAAVAAIGLALAPARPLPLLGLAGVHALGAAWLMRTSRGAPPAPGGHRHLFLPYLLWLASWIVLGRLYEVAGRTPHDAPIAAWDLAIFGGPWHARLSEIFGGAAVDQAMQFFYLSYYGIVLGPLVVFVLQGRIAATERYTLNVMAAYLACFVVYLVFPVVGPRALAAAAVGPPAAADGLAGIAETLRRLGDSHGTAFPSSHCAAALAAALAATFRSGRWARAGMVAWALLIAVATVHTGNHYTLDSAAGVVLALAVRRAVA